MKVARLKRALALALGATGTDSPDILFNTAAGWLDPILIILQFPVYGIVLALAVRRNWFRFVLLLITVFHLVGVALGLVIDRFH